MIQIKIKTLLLEKYIPPTYVNDDGYINDIYNNQTEVFTHIDWDDCMYIFGQWKQFPSWKELRQAYERTIWFHKGPSWYRDRQLNRIL